MKTILFRQFPARAQSYLAERRETEGWFDEGWEVDEGRQGADRWFVDRKVVIGDGHNWAGNAWTKAHEMWEAHARRNGLYLSPAQQEEKSRQAKAYRDAFGVKAGDVDPRLGPEDVSEELRASFEAHRQLSWYQNDRRLTNIAHFLAQTEAESTRTAVTARKLFFQAQRKHKAVENAEALRLYEQGLALWKELLNERDEFRADLDVQEQTYKIQWDYLGLLQDQETGRLRHLKPLLVLEDFLSQGLRPGGATMWLPSPHLIHPKELGSPVVGPFDGLAKDGKPFISAVAVLRARGRLGFGGARTGATEQPSKSAEKDNK
jgi:hypothetical protein